jgi:dephospho-CoA kinase
VRSLSDVDDPRVVAALDGAGFPRPTVTAEDNAKDGTSWPKRFLASADPGRPVNVHVREVGSPGWRWALQFRDWMRADEGARTEYAAEKRRLAEGTTSVEEYADAKEPWFDAVHERAEAWAARTGWEPSRG